MSSQDLIDGLIRDFTPVGRLWRPLDKHFERAFAAPDPRKYYGAIFELYERFPDDDGAGVLWSALHGMEAVGGYEDLLLQSFRRRPSMMTKIMLRRLHNSGQTHIGETEILPMLLAADPDA